MYALEMGESEKAILEQARQQRGPIPQRILDAPILFLGLDWYYVAFGKLTTCRSFGMGSSGPIPWTAINDFCIANGVSGDDQEELEFIIEKMDNAYVKYCNKKAENKSAERNPLKGKTTARRR